MIQQKDAAASYMHASTQGHTFLLAEQTGCIMTQTFNAKTEDLL